MNPLLLAGGGQPHVINFGIRASLNQGTSALLVRNVLMRLWCNARAVSSIACDTESAIDKSVIFVYCEWVCDLPRMFGEFVISGISAKKRGVKRVIWFRVC